jgi:hypothetical protein
LKKDIITVKKKTISVLKSLVSDKYFAPLELAEVVGFRILQRFHSYGVIRKEKSCRDDMFVEKSKTKYEPYSGASVSGCCTTKLC